MTGEVSVLRDLFVAPDFDAAKITVSFTAPRGLVAGTGRWKILAAPEAAFQGEEGGATKLPTKRLAAGRFGPKAGAASGKVKFTAAIPDFRAWTLDAPFLYRLVLTMTIGGRPAMWRRGPGGRDGRCCRTVRIETDFGMRKFHVQDKRIYMNNKPLYIRGVIRGREAHDHANLSGLPEAEYYAKFIRVAKKLGFNFIRFHSRVPSEEYFRSADRLGILTHVEVRKYYGKYQKERDLMDHDPVLVRPGDWRDAILRIRNHPSLMVYCLGNEINRPGRNPEVGERAKQLRRLDSTRLFIDTCARGEYDRGVIDLDVQHMGYFAPFGRNYSMFDTTANWAIFGSVTGKDMVTRAEPAGQGGLSAATRREVPVNYPIIAHEVGHYIAHRDLDALKKKFAAWAARELQAKSRRPAACATGDAASPARPPWWIDELIELRKLKGLDSDYPRILAASTRFQYLWHKQVFESIRRSPILNGFNFLQLADTDRYENANGLLDCFDDLKDSVRPADYLKFNSDAVVIADLPRRTFFEGETLAVPIWLSNCSDRLAGQGALSWRLRSKGGGAVWIGDRLDQVDLPPGLSRVATVEIRLPASDRPEALELVVSIKPAGVAGHQFGTRRGGKADEAANIISNDWNLWLYPNRLGRLAIREVAIAHGMALWEINLRQRYPQLRIVAGGRMASVRQPAQPRLMIADRFTDAVFDHLRSGGDVLMLYRVAETRDRAAAKEKFFLPSTWDRFKPVIWDRGHNLGGFLPAANHPALAGFPCDGFLDFQFAGIIDDCDKLNLDGFPVSIRPIIQGVDKAVRDRYDVFTFKLRELQPDWTMRKFAYLFDLAVGAGRLLVSGFNLTGLSNGPNAPPEAATMFESLVACAASRAWRPRARISLAELRAFLTERGRQDRIKERMMTQYWQLDDAPLESAQYWKDAEAWIRAGR